MAAAGDRCAVCGADLTDVSVRGRAGRPAQYCSSACRQRAYRQRVALASEPAAAPAFASPVAARSGPPAPLDSFVGREAELADLMTLLDRYRLVTLLGPGGAGKTRIAVEVATRVRGRYPDGVWMVELASLTDPALLAQTVADGLGVPEEVGRPVPDTLVDALRGWAALLVLDNCEHLVEPAARLAEQLLRRCPQLRVLVTSRESLELPGEAIFRVGELSLPPRAARPRAAQLLASDAVRLFVERASASAPGFTLTDENAPHIAAICADLDGLPLAIELAARRARLFPVAEIRARLADRFRLLTAGPRTAAERHRDLRATIDWSYDLLEPVEQLVFCRLSILVGGFDVATATAVCADERVPAADVLDLLSTLEARSLIGPVAGAGGRRFRQLESIRLYGRERLTDEDVVFDRLTGYLVGLAAPIVGDGLLHSYEEFQPLDVERANLLVATEWAARRGDPRHLLLAAALGRCWRQHGYLTEGWALLRSALEAAPPDHPGRSAALVQAARLVRAGGNYELARSLAEEAVRIEERGGHPARTARALDALAAVYVAVGERERAYQVVRHLLDLADRLDDPLDRAVCLHNQAYHLSQTGYVAQAGELMAQCLPLYRENSPYPLPAEWLHSAGELALARGDLAAADGYLREGLERYVTVDGADGLPVIAVDMLDSLAVVAAGSGQPVRALRLEGAADRVRKEWRLSREATAQEHRDVAVAVARLALPADRAAAAERAGADLTTAEAVRYAVHDVWPDEPAGPATLTEREHVLARLVAEGWTNRQIATRLRLTERAVEAALRSLRVKLGLRSRAQLAAWSGETHPPA